MKLLLQHQPEQLQLHLLLTNKEYYRVLKRFRKSIPYILFLYGIFFFTSTIAQSKDSLPYLKVKDPKFNFGTVTQGKVVEIEYTFENTGKNPLTISDIEVTCGCTVADFPHYPIRQGDSGMIMITFNTKEKYDKQDRTVKVISNASNSPTKLRFYGHIAEDKSDK